MASMLAKIATLFLVLDDDATKSQPPLKQRKGGDIKQLVRSKNFDYVSTSPALDLCTVDTMCIVLPLQSIEILLDNGLQITPTMVEEKNFILFHTSDGTPIKGRKAIWRQINPKKGGNHTSLYVKIGRMSRGWLDGNNVGCLIKFSLPGLLGKGDNSWPVLNGTLAKQLIQKVQDDLRGMGIIADLRTAKIVRCDLNRNIVPEAPFEDYQRIFKALHQPRTQMTNYGATGIRFTNKSQSFLLYDKIAQMKKHGLSTEHLAPNLGRIEWQVKRAKNVRKKLGISTVQDLLDHWHNLPSLFIEAITTSIFGWDITALQAPQPRLERMNQTPIQKQISNLLHWCQKHGISHDLDRHKLEYLVREGNIRAYAQIIKSVPGMDRKHANDAVRRMRTASLRELAKRDELIVQYEEVGKKLEGGQCWPYLSVDELREIEESAIKQFVYRGPHDLLG